MSISDPMCKEGIDLKVKKGIEVGSELFNKDPEDPKIKKILKKLDQLDEFHRTLIEAEELLDV